MLREFPNRTLEELDEMDIVRYRRAKLAQHIGDVEEIRLMHQLQKLSPEAVSPEMWEQIAKHDELVEDGE